MHISKSSLAVLPHDCVIKLFSIYDSLKSAEKKAADLLISDPHFIMTANISEAAFRAGCSEPTFLRLAKKLNYTGFADLKRHLGTNTEPQALFYNNSINESDSAENVVQKVFDTAIQGLEDTFRMLDVESMQTAANAIKKAGKVVFYGLGDSGLIARALHYKLSTSGIFSLFNEDSDYIQNAICSLDENDVFFAVSNSGKTDLICKMTRLAKEQGAEIISLTNYPNSPLARMADIVLLSSVYFENLYGGDTYKRAAHMCIIEALITLINMK